MSKVLIISDTHFMRKLQLLQFLSQFNDIDYTIHCGDIYIGYKKDDIPNFSICKGNNDFIDIPSIHHITIDNVNFVFTHGHINSYAYKPETLKELLDKYPSDVICFGHTHVPYIMQEDNLLIINPGSLALSRTYPKRNTYAIYDTTTKKASFHDAQTHEIIQI